MVSSDHALLALLDAGCWAVWSTICGYVAHRLPSSVLARPPWPSPGRVERFETRLRIQAWKDTLPEAGALFRGGFSKRHLQARDRASLERFAIETRRAEIAHWSILALGPAFFVWNPWWLALAMLVYAGVANVPCIAVQRYNRARLAALLGRRAAPPASHREEHEQPIIEP
jgi:glycosyl-4,4'-diaponeurosporenoate acyltransferase